MPICTCRPGCSGLAALTAICAKVAVENINSDLATFIRTVIIVCVLASILLLRGQLRPPATISGRTHLFVSLSGLATGASWLCYFRALQLGDAAPLDKLSVVLVALFGVAFLGEHLASHDWFGVVMVAAGVVLIAIP